MNTPAKPSMLALLAIAALEESKHEIFDIDMEKKQEVKKNRRKNSVMKMNHQCPVRQQFRRKTTPNR